MSSTSNFEFEIANNNKETFQPPDFGITVLGSSHGNESLFNLLHKHILLYRI